MNETKMSMDKVKQTEDRTKYAQEQFDKEVIPYHLVKPEIGHFNLYFEDKVCMSFWARTGKIYSAKFTIGKHERGIKRCIEIYKERKK